MPRYLHTTSSIYGGFPPSFTAPRYPTACRACHEPLTPYMGTPGWWLFTRSRRPLGHTPERPVASATCATPISTWANVAGSLVTEYPLALPGTLSPGSTSLYPSLASLEAALEQPRVRHVVTLGPYYLSPPRYMQFPSANPVKKPSGHSSTTELAGAP